ncbi:MAG: hypothetical protein Q9191_000054 [Dirinaria sp. TL-2023a]
MPASPAHLQRQREADKPRLTHDQKKTNHITSEQNRRNFLRSQFDRLSEIVPDAKGKARSEALVLERLVEYGHAQLKEGRKMIEIIERQGGAVDPRLRMKYFEAPHFNAYEGIDEVEAADKGREERTTLLRGEVPDGEH